MTGVDIEFKFPDLEARLKRAEGEINLFLAAAVQTNRGMLFDSEGKYNGRPGWAPLKMRKGQILSDRGVLRKSIAPYSADGKPGPDGIVVIQPDAIIVGTKLLYAAMMNYGTAGLPGGVLRPKYAKALKIPVGRGKFIFRKSVRIPARPFNDWNQEDQNEVSEALTNKAAEVLNRD